MRDVILTIVILGFTICILASPFLIGLVVILKAF